jgi:D-serine deaminase-like pyridoxal phosphate-dependent protein
LAGVAGYEGLIGVGRDARTLAAVDAYLTQLRDLAAALLDRRLVERPIVTAGGSLFFDRVVSVLAGWAQQSGADVVLRSGCYLIHDHGIYATGTPAASGIEDAPALTAALSVWARVLSTPEPGLALLDAGRRDLSHDAGLPVPLQRVRDGASTDLEGPDTSVIALSDQHAFMRYPDPLDIHVGDLVRLGISHPCTTLDRHREIFLVDSADRIVGAIHTSF